MMILKSFFVLIIIFLKKGETKLIAIGKAEIDEPEVYTPNFGENNFLVWYLMIFFLKFFIKYHFFLLRDVLR